MTKILKSKPQRRQEKTQSDLSLEYLEICKFEMDPTNPRMHSEKQVRQIAASIQQFGFAAPILTDSNRRIIAGHGRLSAAKLLGMSEVPTICLSHLTPLQAKALLLADNKLSENASWDDGLLAQQLAILAEAELDFDIEVTGFSIGEVDSFVDELSCEGEEEDSNSARDDTLPAVSAAGDVWQLGKNRVVCGDALSAATLQSLMGDRRASVVFTDPPFNVRIYGHATGLGKTRHREFVQASGEMTEREFTDFLTVALSNAAGCSEEGSIHYVCMDWRHFSEIQSAGRKVFSELKNLCVWVKDHGGMGSFYRSQHELIFVFKKGNKPHRNNFELGQHGRYRTNVWQYPSANSFSRSSQGEGNLLALHPTVKPVTMVVDAIMDVTKRGEIVLDPFLGSGTTLIAAERTGRVCFGIEIDPLYVDTIVRRWEKFTGASATHSVSGRTFKELQEERLSG